MFTKSTPVGREINQYGTNNYKFSRKKVHNVQHVPVHLKDKVDKKIKEMVDKRIIEKYYKRLINLHHGLVDSVLILKI